nr:serine/threonine-protein kinase PRP4 homolog [Dermatophagoides farinae]
MADQKSTSVTKDLSATKMQSKQQDHPEMKQSQTKVSASVNETLQMKTSVQASQQQQQQQPVVQPKVSAASIGEKSLSIRSKAAGPVSGQPVQSNMNITKVPPSMKAMANEKSISMKNSALQPMTKKSAFVPSKMHPLPQPLQQHTTQQSTTGAATVNQNAKMNSLAVVPKSKIQDFDTKTALQPFKGPNGQQLMQKKSDQLSVGKSVIGGLDGKSLMTESSVETRETLTIKISQGKDTTEITQVIEKKSPSSKRKKRSRSPRLMILPSTQQEDKAKNLLAIKGPPPPPSSSLEPQKAITAAVPATDQSKLMEPKSVIPTSGIVEISTITGSKITPSLSGFPIVDESGTKISIKKSKSPPQKIEKDESKKEKKEQQQLPPSSQLTTSKSSAITTMTTSKTPIGPSISSKSSRRRRRSSDRSSSRRSKKSSKVSITREKTRQSLSGDVSSGGSAAGGGGGVVLEQKLLNVYMQKLYKQ